MKRFIVLFVCLVFAMTVLVAGGCSKKEEPAKPSEPAKTEEVTKPAEPEKKPEEVKPAEKAPEKAPEKK